MDFTQVILTTIIYIVLFFLLEKIMINEKSSIYYKLGYSLVFAVLIILVNLLSRQMEEPPQIEVTIFQISLVILLVSLYMGYEVYKLKRNKKSNNE